MNRSRATGPIVGAIVLLAGLVAIELAFGGWLRDTSIARLRVPRSVRWTFDARDLYGRTAPVTYTRDRWGLRGRVTSPGEVDLLTIGGSATDQRYISDGETWQDGLQDCLSRRGTPLVVANAGIDGQSTVGHIRNFQWWFPAVPGLRPRYVLFFVGLNDLVRAANDVYDDPLVPESFWGGIRHRSALWNLIGTIRGMIRARITTRIAHRRVRFEDAAWTRERNVPDIVLAFGRRIDDYRRNLRWLAGRTRDMGAIPIFVTQPARFYRVRQGEIEGVASTTSLDGARPNGVDLYHLKRAMDETMMRECRNAGGICVDVEHDATHWDDRDFYDYGHLSPEGTVKLAMLLCRTFEASGALAVP